MARNPNHASAALAAEALVPTRVRQDGWTPEKQGRFLEALAESACVEEACRTVGISKQSAYRLRTRIDAQGFRRAWDAALDLAVQRLSDACLARALHGEEIPHYYQGELVGTHRRYDNRLAQFLLRYHMPLRYAATRDQMVYEGHPEQAAIAFARARDRAMDEAYGVTPPPAPPPAEPYRVEPIYVAAERQKAELKEAQAQADRAAAEQASRERAAEDARYQSDRAAERAAWEARAAAERAAAAERNRAAAAAAPIGVTADGLYDPFAADAALAAAAEAETNAAVPSPQPPPEPAPETASGGDVPSLSSPSAPEPAAPTGFNRYIPPWPGTPSCFPKPPYLSG